MRRTILIDRVLRFWAVLALFLSSSVVRAEAKSGAAIQAQDVVYVCSNDPRPGLNSILAYRRDPVDGSLTELPGSPFLTRGTGDLNPAALLGPNDHDQEIVIDRTRRLLFTTNPGSNTIAVFRILAGGQLRHVPGSPFPSGGEQPVSLGLAGNRLYVVNKNQNPGNPPNLELPNYVGFDVLLLGRLRPIPQSRLCVTAGSSPTQALVSPSGEFLFGADLFSLAFDNGPMLPPFASFLQAFRIDAPTGRLQQHTPQIPPLDGGAPLILGLQVHPTEPIVYAGFVGRNELAVYTYDGDGRLTFSTAVPNSGLAICWILVDATGQRLYTTNTADASVSTYDITNPYLPAEIQSLVLKERGVLNPPGLPNLYSSGPFQLALSRDGTSLYIVSQRDTPDPTVVEGNLLHVLDVQANGTLVETLDPLPLPVPIIARPHGLATL